MSHIGLYYYKSWLSNDTQTGDLDKCMWVYIMLGNFICDRCCLIWYCRYDFYNICDSVVFCALHDQLASLGRHVQLTCCFSAVAELLVMLVNCVFIGCWYHWGHRHSSSNTVSCWWVVFAWTHEYFRCRTVVEWLASCWINVSTVWVSAAQFLCCY